MKRIVVLSVLSLFFIAGCHSEEYDYTGDPTIEGYLVEVEDKSILVVDGITKEQAVHMSWIELSKVDGKQYDAHSFHIDSSVFGFFESFTDVKKGDKVKVWGKGGANESYPPQSKLGKIELTK
ncbi:YobA family protein [Halobacillus sp. A1]|uniref:YobA family protein n=1 Tax=Halobacillus sp. A1 TaxID=2880262 RepID=UPI0020A6D052|nr:YobA family protein [Halobacillus sp. A1]MCP3032866.1 YobA family protein [Halobacillus sp. A1]